MNSFDKNVLRIIDKLSYNFFLVQQNKNIRCTCQKIGTGQALPGCPRCLGTGYKIKIREAYGASQESTMPATVREQGAFVIARNYYINYDYHIDNDNIIVDDGEVFFVYQQNELRGFHGQKVYQKCLSMKKKTDVTAFLEAFNKIVKR